MPETTTPPMSEQALQDALNGLSYQQIQDAIDLETATDKENNDWLAYLKNQVSGGTKSTTSGTFLGKYGMYILGAGVFVLVLMVFNTFGKNKK